MLLVAETQTRADELGKLGIHVQRLGCVDFPSIKLNCQPEYQKENERTSCVVAR